MKNYFPFLIIIVLSVGLGITYLFNNNNLTLINYEPHIRHLLGIAFAISSTSLLFYHFRHSFTSKSHIFAYNSLVALMLGILLCTSIFHEDISFVAMLFYSAVVVIHFGYQRKIYWSYTIATVIIGYGFFLLAGTIYSAKGFRFPLEIIPFIILPLSLYLFSLSKDNLLRITMVFVRIMMLYMSFSIIYWSFNHYYLETDFITWTTHKLNFQVNMIGWEEQFKDMFNSNYYSAYFFVNSWSGYFHPSYISVVLCSGLILAFYLYQENTLKTSFSRIELGAYVLLCFVMEALMESRIGMVGFIFIVFSGTLYVSKSKSKYFNLLLIIYIFISLAGFYFFNDAITGFVNDEIRTIYRQLSYEYIYSHPWWGTGYGGQPEVLNPLMKQLYPDSPYVYTPIPYVHNQFLGNMVQFGIWGALALTIVFIALTIYGLKNKNFYLLLYLGFYFLFMMIEEPLSRQDGISRFVIFLVFLLALSRTPYIERKHIRMQTNKKRILVDLTPLIDLFCGLGQVALTYGNYFQKTYKRNDSKLSITLLVPKEMIGKFGDEVEYLSSSNKITRKFQFLLPKFDVWHSIHQSTRYRPRHSSTKYLLTVHDLNYLYEKQGIKKISKQIKIQKKIARANEIVCISEFAKSEVENNLKLHDKKCHVIYNHTEPLDAEKAKKPAFDVKQPFFFSIGVIQKKKNFHVLLDLMKLLPDKHLYIAGKEHRKPKQNGYANLIKDRIVSENISNVTLLGPISHDEKIWYYENCEAFLFPSLFEGFGLPLIEAMQFGKPVFSSKETSLKEIGNEHAFFWDSFEADEMKSVITNNLKLFDEERKQKEIAYANSFATDNHFVEYIKLYESI